MTRVSDLYDADEYGQLLEDAERNAKTKWEMDFVDGLKDNFDLYAERAFLSERQQEILERVAG